jgi:hypothetical protein
MWRMSIAQALIFIAVVAIAVALLLLGCCCWRERLHKPVRLPDFAPASP